MAYLTEMNMCIRICFKVGIERFYVYQGITNQGWVFYDT